MGSGDRVAALLARHLRGDGGHGLPRRQQRPLRVRHLHPEQAPAAHFSGTAVCRVDVKVCEL